jgi:hypothetical protein
VLRCGAYWDAYLDDADYPATGNVAFDETPDYGWDRAAMDSLPARSIFVDYFVPSVPGKLHDAGKPWRSLTLVFEAIGDDWKLTQIVHQDEDHGGGHDADEN